MGGDDSMIQEKRFVGALRSSEPAQALRALVQELTSEGWSRDEIYNSLEECLLQLRQSSNYRDSDENVLTDVMDALTGWCHSNAQLFPDNK
jgi:hypothetical protein